MTELTVPRDVDQERAAELVSQHVSVGDVVEVWERDRTDADDPEHDGEVTGIETGYLELDGQPPGDGSVRYDQIGTVVKVENADE